MFHGEAMREKRRRWKKMSAGKKALVIAGWMAAIAALVSLIGLAVMLLWNRIMSGILGLPVLGFWESIGLFILAKLLFGGRGVSLMHRMRMRRAMRESMAAQTDGGEGSQD
jgi:hypothetical protein